MKIRSNKRNESGISYFAVVIALIIIGATLASYLTLVASQNQMTMRSQAWNRSVAVLEAGMEEALAHLNKNAACQPNGSFVVNLASDGWQVDPAGGWSKTNTIGDDYYYVRITSFTPGNYYPNIISEAYVKQTPTFAMRVTGPLMAAIDTTLNTQPAPVPSGYVRRTVLGTTTNLPTFTKALVAKETLDLSGQNVRTDSFDSTDPDKSTNRRYDIAKRRDNGDIAANRAVTNSLSPVTIGNANIYGRVSTGPNSRNPGVAVVDVGAAGKVGSTNWQAGSTYGIQPGWAKDDMNMDFPNVVLPYSAGSGPDTVNPITGQKYTVDGITYDMYLRNGDYILNNNQTLSGKIYVERHVRLIVPYGANVNMSGADCITIATNGSLMLYVDCPSASLSGNGIQNPNVCTNFYYYGTQNHTSLSYGGNATFTGVFYAPNAAMTFNGSGGSQADFSGAAIARTIKLNGNFTFHYDEALKRYGVYRGYVLTSWNEQ
jgi:hypothetical protein